MALDMHKLWNNSSFSTAELNNIRKISFRLELAARLSETNEKYLRHAQSYIDVFNSIVSAAAREGDTSWLNQTEPFPVTAQSWKLFAIHAITLRPGAYDRKTGQQRIGCMMSSLTQFTTGIKYVNTALLGYEWIFDHDVRAAQLKSEWESALAYVAHTDSGFAVTACTSDMMAKLWLAHDRYNISEVQCMQAMQHAFEFFLRSNEYVDTKTKMPIFIWEHLHIETDTGKKVLCRTIQQAKTAKKKKPQVVKAQQRQDDNRCPVRAMLAHRKIMNKYTRKYFGRNLLPSDPVFVEFNDAGNPICKNDHFVPLSSRRQTLILRRIAKRAHIDPTISANSARSGAATTALRMNRSLRQIQLLGRWESLASLVYMRMLDADLIQYRDTVMTEVARNNRNLLNGQLTVQN